MNSETWKPITAYPGYEVSSEGRVRGPRGIRSQITHPSGYKQVKLRGTSLKVSRLVCEAFHRPPPLPSSQACHDNHVRDDNRKDNLHWGTPKQNSEERIQAGRQFKGKPSKALCDIDAIMKTWREGEAESPTATLLQVDEILTAYFNQHLFFLRWRDKEEF